MAINLITVLQDAFSAEAYKDISNHVDISTESTKNGLKVVIPATLASISKYEGESSPLPSCWNALDNVYRPTDAKHINTQNIHNPTFVEKGREILWCMFRKNHDELVATVATVAGVQKAKASKLVEVGVPLVVGFLKNWMLHNGWTFNDLMSNLSKNNSLIAAALPEELAFAHFEMNNSPKVNFSKTMETPLATAPTPVSKKRKNNNAIIWLAGLILVALLALLLWYLLNNTYSKSNRIDIDTNDMLVPGVKDTVATASFY